MIGGQLQVLYGQIKYRKKRSGSSQLDRLVYFNVFPEARKDTSDLPEAAPKSFHEILARWLYFVIFPVTNALRVHVAHVVAFFFHGTSMTLLKILGFHCVREFDLKMMAVSPVLKNLPRLFMMMYFPTDAASQILPIPL